MMKMMILAPRRVGMTHAEFRRYVTEVHGPLVRGVPEVAAGIRHYHYNFPIPGASDPAFGHPIAAHLDVVTQGWFDSHEAQLLNMAQPRYLQIIRPDEGRFANEAGAVMHYTREEVITGGPSTMTKIFYFRRRHPSLTREAFQKEWLKRFPEALGDWTNERALIARYVQNHALSEADHPNGTDAKFFDVIDEFFVTTPRDLAAIAQAAPTSDRMREVEHALLDGSRTRAFVAETIHNIP
jgi:EthD domain